MSTKEVVREVDLLQLGVGFEAVGEDLHHSQRQAELDVSAVTLESLNSWHRDGKRHNRSGKAKEEREEHVSDQGRTKST